MIVDAIYRLAYRVAYKGARLYWKVAHPANNGALVTIWHEGKVLLVRNSYVDYYSLPGGYVKKSETALQAAVRELKEEVNLEVDPDSLVQVLDHTHEWEGREDHVVIFELLVDEQPMIQVDNREVVSAEWFSPREALALELFSPLRELVERKARTDNSPEAESE